MTERSKRNYIRYTAEELAAVPSPWQMERELAAVGEEFGLGMPMGEEAIKREYKLLKALGKEGYVAQRRIEDAAERGQHRHRHHPHTGFHR